MFNEIDLISKHNHLLDMLKWEDEDIYVGELVQAVECTLNPGIPDLNDSLKAYIYVDDILASAVNKHNILRLLAATINAIFTVVIILIMKFASVHFLLRNGKMWLAWSKLFWGLLLIRIDSWLESLPNI
jgi:hypothetical protein